MNEAQSPCPNCQRPLPPDSPLGLCPECLVKSGFRTGPKPGAPEFTAPAAATIAGWFPQFQILELLGQGGMGAVYRARQPGLDRFVALKILSPAASADPGFAERFSREARALARLNHPNIVAVHDFGQAGEYFYLVMELVDGMNLRQLERSGRLPPEQALRLVPQICDALQFAHDEGVVHRDIKPENILIDKRGRVKIADFGIAKLTGAGPEKVGLTGGRDVLGTPHYMAPEQLEKPDAVDHRADIYSLGVVFYELLTGELPLGRFPPPSSRVQVDVRLDDIVLRTLEKEPERRYQQASEVKTAVQTVGTTPPPLRASPAPPFAARPPAAARRNSIALIVAMVLGLCFLFLAGAGLLLFMFYRVSVKPQPVSQPGPPSVSAPVPPPAASPAPPVTSAAAPVPADPTPDPTHLRYRWTTGDSLVYAVNFSADKEHETETQSGNFVCHIGAVNGEVATINCQNHLGTPQHHPKSGQTTSFPFAPMFWHEMALAAPRQMQIDSAGNFLEGSGDGRQLPQALGNVEDLIFEPLPPHDEWAWTADGDCLVTLEHFVRLAPMSSFGRQEQTQLAAHEQSTYRAEPAANGLILIHRSYELKTRELAGGQPRVQLTGEGTNTFDAIAGQLQALEFTGTLVETTSNTTWRIPLTLSCRLLTSREKTNALTRTVPEKNDPKPLTVAELRSALLDLKSGRNGFRQAAAARLAAAKPTEPRDEVVQALIPALDDANWPVRQNAARALGVWATADAYPALIKVLDDPEFSVRWAAIAALGGSQDATCATALAGHLARGTDLQPGGNALRAIGAPAEPAVLDLLNSDNQQVRNEACRILKDIGTKTAIPALTTAAADSDGITAMLAREALASVEARQ